MEQVVIVGAGPVGLWLAAELRLGGAAVTVLESRPERDPHSKALTVHPRTIEVLAFRGVADRFLAEGVRIPDGHFGGLDSRMDFGGLDTPFPFTLALPQARTEELLAEHARSVGARVRRGHRVTGLTQTADAVSVEVEGPAGPYVLDAGYVVGCDGTRSTVRAAAGIAFPGTDTTTWGWLGDVVLDDPPPGAVLDASGPRGGVMVVALPGGVHRFVGCDPGGHRADWPGDLTLDELRATVTSITGTDFGMRDPVWLSRFGNATRQAERYRSGRVLLAGDAAHMHFPTGGVGLNVGVQDATNLGWKLAATVTGRASDDLLDTYHAERHPVGADLLVATRAQTALMTSFTPETRALRSLLGDLIATVPEFSRDLAERLSALAVAYPPTTADAHPLTGKRAPDLRFRDGTGLFGLLRAGRHVLLDLADDDRAVPDVGITTHRAPLAEARDDWEGVRFALIRPDGHVAWAGADITPVAREAASSCRA
ncbi:FAD-dependent monooxygenase [Saccharothrix australiensis]|uniref:2-polyprenyl-6-methoxyphenol hydroxylase-like FAD-dependent oxidoreductase n=1 Tax=Saccharothrix australiensis TaxID=2072 RepID=A0A495VYF3_9PSEU|nr:FAD-dependent monooxygenase [Saccharothrix australiensis]RKT53767.1 2-polyprenyl-6-methoxyphenol hydroxylase-like FAD-dependent oxidoreductase [Saccharothrix australiensis]